MRTEAQEEHVINLLERLVEAVEIIADHYGPPPQELDIRPKAINLEDKN